MSNATEKRQREQRAAKVATLLPGIRPTRYASATGTAYPAYRVPSASDPGQPHVVVLDPPCCDCECWTKSEGTRRCTHLDAAELFAAVLRASSAPAVRCCQQCQEPLPAAVTGTLCAACYEQITEDVFGKES